MDEKYTLTPRGSAGQLSKDPLIIDDERLKQRLSKALSEKFNMEPELSAIAWEIASWPTQITNEEREALSYMVLTAMINLNQGSTTLPIGDGENNQMLNLLKALLSGDPEEGEPPFPSPEAMVKNIRKLIRDEKCKTIIGKPGKRVPFLIKGGYLYHEKLFKQEGRFVEVILKHLKRPSLPGKKAEASRVLSKVAKITYFRGGGVLPLTPQQKEAAIAAICQPISIITGGPGTGKTTLIVTILRTLVRMGIKVDDISLAAFTGRAAKRMRESIVEKIGLIPESLRSDEDKAILTIEPKTIHRLLGSQPWNDSFRHHENNPLPAKVLIIDEASMIDLWLMDALLSAVSKEEGENGTQVILIGDADQLPSVDAGAVLRDLIYGAGEGSQSPLKGRSHRLIGSLRVDLGSVGGINILNVAEQINRGETPRIVAGTSDEADISLFADAAGLQFDGVEFIETSGSSSKVQPFLDRWFELLFPTSGEIRRLIQNVYNFDGEKFDDPSLEGIQTLLNHLDQFRLLCFTRERKYGRERVNDYFHSRIARLIKSGDYSPFLCGEPVMMTQNDYNRNIFNGDTGFILNVSEKGKEPQLMTLFPTSKGPRAFNLISIKDKIEHAFAITVHKSQGSEYRNVGLLLPDEDIPLNTREIVYTAISRAKSSVVIVGQEAILRAGVERRLPRFSTLGMRLVERMGEE
ncbi:MAG: exodeoxyribonuclease V subunit alpha [Oligoflexales bacterium]|nr:exodeoxyribonuclease V subunit alpha [Oligoflexales bacterium]